LFYLRGVFLHALKSPWLLRKRGLSRFRTGSPGRNKERFFVARTAHQTIGRTAVVFGLFSTRKCREVAGRRLSGNRRLRSYLRQEASPSGVAHQTVSQLFDAGFQHTPPDPGRGLGHISNHAAGRTRELADSFASQLHLKTDRWSMANGFSSGNICQRRVNGYFAGCQERDASGHWRSDLDRGISV